MTIFRYVSESEQQTRGLAKRLGALLEENDCLALLGDFGSGKTTFVKGLAQGVGLRKKDYVASPSFVILKIYEGRLPVYHFDLYRLRSERDAESVGLYEFVTAGGIAVIEWADRVRGSLPCGTLEIKFRVKGLDKRELRFKTSSARLARALKKVLACLKS